MFTNPLLPKIRRRRRRGAVIMEMALVLPLLFLILSLLFFFGRGLKRVQHAQVMDRYEAWREAGGGPGPEANTQLMNDAFLENKATGIEFSIQNGFPSIAADRLQAAGAAKDVELGQLIAAAFDGFPRGNTVSFTASHASSIKLWQDFERPIEHGHCRIGNDWKFVNEWTMSNGQWVQRGSGPWMLYPARDCFLQELDGNLQGIANGGNELAPFLQSLYLQRPGYIGPTVDYVH